MNSIAFLSEAFLLGLALSMDCFTVSITCGLQKSLSLRRALFMAFMFALFQGLMPFLGCVTGGLFKQAVEYSAHWISFALLFILGLKMIMEGRRFTLREKLFDTGSFKVILLLSIATSIDAFLAGIGFAMHQTFFQQVFTSVVITVITFVMSLIGWKMGERFTFIKPRFALSLGGVILILLGVKSLVIHYLL
ncbi:MAG: manganese efflux pump [Bacteroidales bacterium]|nr:manganese efflux pump [Bacteroidales bacterium]